MDNSIEKLTTAIKRYYRRNKSLPDTLSKLSVSTDKTVRSAVKAATHCGCIEFFAKKQTPLLNRETSSHIKGKLCNVCRDEIEQDIGQTFFYLFSLCDAFGFDPEKIIENQAEQVEILGKFNLR